MEQMLKSYIVCLVIDTNDRLTGGGREYGKIDGRY